MTEVQRLALPGLFVLLVLALGLSAYATLQPLGGTDALLHPHGLQPVSSELSHLLVTDSWAPRLCLALLAGAALALAGELLQLLLRNPLASPSTLAINSGAQLALLAAALLLPALEINRWWIALGGATLSVSIVFLLGWRQRLSPLTLVLAGLMLNLLLSALATLLLLFNHDRLAGMMVWGAGSLVQNGWRGVELLTPWLLVCLLLTALLLKPLQTLQLGEASIRSLGVNLTLLRLSGLALAVALSASVVSCAGPIGFVGLAAPNAVRLLGVRRLSARVPLSALLGALLLALTDQLVQLYAQHSALFLPTGALSAALAAPLLLWLLTRLRLAPAVETAPPPQVHSSTGLSPWIRLALISGVLLLAALLALGYGRAGLTPGWTWSALDAEAILEWRLPRTLAAASGGGMLALAGTLLQRLSGNPMASPELLGISSGSGIALLIGVFLLATPDRGDLALLATGGALAALTLILLLNYRNRLEPMRLLLSGVALSALFEALRGALLADGDPRGQQMLAWLAGSTYYVDLPLALWMAGTSISLLLLVLPLSRWLDILPLGDACSRSLGLPLSRVRLGILLLAALLSALATLAVGPFSFIGLMAPHLARLLGLQRALWQLLASALLGAGLMLLADWGGRQLLFPQEIPAGLMASTIGAVYVLRGLARMR